MTAVLVDSNVILDVASEDPRWGSWSSAALTRAGNTSQLVINPLIFAEISVRYASIEEVDDVVPPASFRREALPYDAAFLAGKCFVDYRRRGGTRTAPLPDFYIGAHAAISGYRLLTRDARRFRTYFPALEVIAPEA